MKILGIETSCDETSAAVVEKFPDGNLKILSNIVASSSEMHAKTGGVIPENAAREQIKSIIPVIDEALSHSGASRSEAIESLDAIAVTVGPGLIGSLLVGVETAKTLSRLWQKPIVPVNHLIGHVYANWLNQNSLPNPPALALVVSGGHTDLVLLTDASHEVRIKYIGGTRDDAAGEAFDKTARLLHLPYPGGPNISNEAQKFIDKNPNAKLTLFPRPMINGVNLDWSFSGLKTAVLREVQKYKSPKTFNKEKLAAEIQEAIVDSLVTKSLNAMLKYHPKSFLLAGGVAANLRLRTKFQAGITQLRDSGKLPPIEFHVPEIGLCTDNAAPIAAAAFMTYKPTPWQTVSANPELTILDK